MQELQFVRPPQRRITLAAPPAEPEPPDLPERLAVLWRGRRTIAGALVVALGLGAFYLLQLAEPRYRAEAALALDVQGARVVDLEQVVGGLPAGAAAINTELEALRAPALLGELVDALALDADPEFNAALREAPAWWPQETLARLRDGLGIPEDRPTGPETRRRVIEAVGDALTVAGQPRSYVFTISATSSEPGKSEAVVNTLAELHLARQVEEKQRATDEAAEWLSTRVRELDAELRAQEAALKRRAAERDLAGGPAALEALNFQLAEHARSRAEIGRAHV